ncbi:hypothetical protein ACIP29_23560 [Streptomyces coelicoflavus]|uniref:hypothetical protein n=1 Tax=Streptomyces coelicoflavus TaxID=285562 RepID=UPI00381FE50F
MAGTGFFFAQPEIPEPVINADSDAWCRGDPEAHGQENHDEWRAATRRPGVVRAMLEDWTCTATRAPSGATGPMTSGATASTQAITWPRKHRAPLSAALGDFFTD